MALMNDPDRITCPACGVTPYSCSLLASQATALIGLPITARAMPLSSMSPLIDNVAPTLRTSMSFNFVGLAPRITKPHAAASEMLSINVLGPRPA